VYPTFHNLSAPRAADPARRRRALLALGTALAFPGCALRRTEPAPTPVTLPDTLRIDIAAEGRRHRVMIATPPAPPPSRGWPVVYALDGNLTFTIAAQLVRNRFARGPRVASPGAVVVGLGYPGPQVLDLAARTFDYTPPAPGPAGDGRGRRTGGADAFLDFIDAVVRPLVARTAPVDVDRQTLFGHSFGGLCVLHSLFTRPGGFRHYAAASPSAWWRDGFILEAQARFRADRRAGGKPIDLLVTRGELESAMPTDPARAAVARKRRSGDALRTLLDGLRDVPGLQLRFDTIAGADHGGSLAPALQQAISIAIGEAA
jgi:predicted alpha/beta superfamily hydrolase